jgi:hypothetical protein
MHAQHRQARVLRHITAWSWWNWAKPTHSWTGHKITNESCTTHLEPVTPSWRLLNVVQPQIIQYTISMTTSQVIQTPCISKLEDVLSIYGHYFILCYWKPCEWRPNRRTQYGAKKGWLNGSFISHRYSLSIHMPNEGFLVLLQKDVTNIQRRQQINSLRWRVQAEIAQLESPITHSSLKFSFRSCGACQTAKQTQFSNWCKLQQDTTWPKMFTETPCLIKWNKDGWLHSILICTGLVADT